MDQRTERLSRELETRTQWALDTNRQLSRELEARGRVEETLSEVRDSLAELSLQHRQLNVQFRKLGEQYEELSEFNTTILTSHSWKVTAPLRAARRLGANFVHEKAWNPLRWPSLLAGFFCNVSRLGLKGALLNLQYIGDMAPVPEQQETSDTSDEPEPPKSFPRVDQPDVSIVIPVHNEWRYTAACLKSLADSAGEYSFEVIVVDDASGDGTEESLIAIGGLNYLRNEENLGFVGSCNRGAGQARGEYLVMLNNDTEVLDGWLDGLIDTLKCEPEAGLVGARLVYPDGRLQESGGIIYSDGSGWNYGREDVAGKPAYNFMREVDYCSGACIALRTELFRELGGFDERYAPAYYEDTDLAFRIRDAGLKVLVQPASTVIHHEGVTSGTDLSTGVKQYQLINQEKFVDRWQEELKLQPGSITDTNDHKALRAASSHRLLGKVLFISADASGSSPASDSERLFDLLQCCRRLGFGVTFVPPDGDLPEEFVARLQTAGIEVMFEPWLSPLSDFFTERGSEFDYVFISRHHVAAEHLSLIDRYCPDSHFVLDTVYLEYLLEEDAADDEQKPLQEKSGDRARESELSVIRAADATLVGSPIEKKVLEKDAPGHKVHVLDRNQSGSNEGGLSTSCKSLAELFDSFT